MPHFYLFLDIDGVLHPARLSASDLSDDEVAQLARSHGRALSVTHMQVSMPDNRDLQRLPLLEDTLRLYLGQVDIVISSSWRTHTGFYRMLLNAMSDDVRARVVGKTPEFVRRASEIKAWLRKHGNPGAIPVILDDAELEGEAFGDLGVWIMPNVNDAFSPLEADALRQVLRGYTFVFLDVESTDPDSPNPELISLGMVPELHAACFRESRRNFYEERPKGDWWQLSSPWVRTHVVPHLDQSQKRGPWCRNSELLVRLAQNWLRRRHLTTYLVTSASEHDFKLIKTLLDPWPANVAPFPIHFDASSVPSDMCFAVSQASMRWYRDNGPIVSSLFNEQDKRYDLIPKAAAPAHHALNDACALRAGWEQAVKLGWNPDKFYRELLVRQR